MAAELKAAISYAEITRSLKTCFVAGFCLSIYDIFQTFPDEVEYYWKGGWNLPRALYLITRHSPVVSEIMDMTVGFLPVPDEACLPIILMMTVLDCVFLVVVSAILIIRIHALYADRRILWGLLILLSMVGTCIFVLSILGVAALKMSDQLVPGVRFCASMSPKLLNKLIWSDWVPILTFDTVLALLAGLVAWRHRGLHQEYNTLLKTLLQGSLAYFLAIVGVAIITIIFERVALLDAPGFVVLEYLLLSACAVRLLLHLRIKDKQLREGRYTGELGPENYMSSMHFRVGHEPRELVSESSEAA